MPESDETSVKSAKIETPEQPKKRRGKRGSKRRRKTGASTAHVAFPKNAISKCIRIPQGVLEQNAGKECTYREAAGFAGLGYTGQLGVEISSAIKYGLLERTSPGK